MARHGLNIYKRRDGRWEGRYKCGIKPDGRARYKSVYAKSYSAVREIMEREKAAEAKPVACKCTVGELLAQWLDDARNKVKESTYANYSMKLSKHILPRFADMRYEYLTARVINEFIREKLDSGLSEKYVSDIVTLLKSAASYAGKTYGCDSRIKHVTLPKAQNIKEKRLLDTTELHRLREELARRNSPCSIGILLASATGMRIGELCALRWSDIDLESGVIKVGSTVQRIRRESGKGTRLVISTPKSRSSLRQIPLPEFMQDILAEGRRGDNCYLLSGTEKLVEPRTLQYRFKRILKELGLTRVSFHSLRHGFASECVAVGVDVKTLSEILGHHSVAVTLNLYVHSTMERKRDCMKLFSDRIGVA